MRRIGATGGRLLAISDLHITHPANRRIVETLRPQSESDWLILCGDVSESVADVEWAFNLLGERFATVVWTPGNHDLWTTPDDPVGLRGEQRYRHLVELARRAGVLTPEDAFPVWEGDGGPLTVAPIFVLYDYSFRSNLAATKAESLALAYEAGVVCSDEFLLHPDPYATREQWCEARIAYTEQRLESCATDAPMLLVNHFPLTDHPTRVLLHPEFAQWCGTTRSADWHRRFNVTVVVYGHLHIPCTTWHDGVRFEEVSLGYPHEWHRRRPDRPVLRRMMPWPE